MLLDIYLDGRQFAKQLVLGSKLINLAAAARES
jgi:hypothetical protein